MHNESLYFIANSSASGKTSLVRFLEREFSLIENNFDSQLLSAGENFIITKKLFNAFLLLIEIEEKLELTENDSILVKICNKIAVNRLANMIISLIIYRDSHPALSSRWGIKIFSLMGKSLIDQESSAFEKGPPFGTLLQLLKYFADLPDSSTLAQFLIDICEKCRWKVRDKNLTFKKILEFQDLWNSPAGSDAVFKSLLKDWIHGIYKIMNSLESDLYEKDYYVRTNIVDCIMHFIRRTKSSSNILTIPGTEYFLPLLDNMPAHKVGGIMWEIYQLDVKEPPPSLKMFETTRDLYRQLCQQFVRSDLTLMLHSATDSFIEKFQCLLWLEDGNCVSIFTDKLLDFYPADKSNSLIKRLVTSNDIRKMAASCPYARSELCLLLRKRLKIVKASIEKEAALAWRILNVSLPGHPIVEKFLKSCDTKMKYANFSSKEQALIFSSEVNSIIASPSGFSVRVQVLGKGFSCSCELTKYRSIRTNEEETLLDEKNLIEEMLDVFKKPTGRKGRGESSECTRPEFQNLMDDDSEEIIELPVPKKVKPDIIDLD